MATLPATITRTLPAYNPIDSLAAIRSAQAQLVGTVQAIVDLYERNPELAYGRLCKAVADYEDVVFADRAAPGRSS